MSLAELDGWLEKYYQTYTTAGLLIAMASAFVADHVPRVSVEFDVVAAATAVTATVVVAAAIRVRAAQVDGLGILQASKGQQA